MPCDGIVTRHSLGQSEFMYRVPLRLVLAGFATVVLPLAHMGNAAQPASRVALQAPPKEGETAIARMNLGDAIDFRIRVAAVEASKEDAAWLAQLRSFYIARGGAPVWVNTAGWNALARSALAELANAEQWGLDPAAFAVPQFPEGVLSDHDLSGGEIELSRAIVKYAHHARGGRIDPSALSLWLDRAEFDTFASAVMIEVISNPEVAAAMHAMHPQTPEFALLRRAYNAMRYEIENPKTLDPAEVLERGKMISVGEWHPDVLIIRKRLKAPAVAGYESQFDEKLANKLDDFLDEKKVKVKWGRIDDKVRAVFNRPPPPPDKGDLMRVLANMERWRWLPRDLGATYIWNSLPEQMTRIFKDGELIHEERIIIGQPDTQTPVFSDFMRQVVFQPEWGVPPSIKINDLLPKLQAGDYDVLERRNMRILGLSGKELNPERFKWDKIDIRDIGIYQRSGDSNPLGRVKFLFPNKHHVYMHDTNNRALFKQSDRLFSHGCVRVRDPEKLAKLLLELDQGLDEDQVMKLLNNWKKPNNKVDLERPIPVHNVYFTLIPGADNTLVKLDDVYGHDKRVIQALSGVPFAKIAASDPARSQLRELDEAAPPMVRRALQKNARGDDDE